MLIHKDGLAPEWVMDFLVGKPFTVHMTNQTRLRGELLAPDGAPAKNAAIEVVTRKIMTRWRPSAYGPLKWEGHADDQGHYDMPLDPGTYDVKVTAADGFVGRWEKFELPADKATALPGRLEKGLTLTVKVVDSQTGQPVKGAKLSSLEDTGVGLIRPKKGSTRTTGADGLAQWDGMLPGTQNLMINAPGYARWWWKTGPQADQRGIDSVQAEVKKGGSVQVLEMQPAIHVDATVVDPSGNPVAGAIVDVVTLQTGDNRYSRITDAQGKAVLEYPELPLRLPMANPRPTGPLTHHRLVASDRQGRWANGLSDWFSAQPGDKLALTIHLQRGGYIHGRVADAAGKPIAGIEVQALPDDKMDRQYYDPLAVTNAQGEFVLGPMRAVPYDLVPDVMWGINVRMPAGFKPPEVTAEDGETTEAGTITYKGPAPDPMPAWYKPKPKPKQTAGQ
jgi:hypothetical protein